MPETPTPSGQRKEKKSPFLDLGYIDQQNKRENKDYTLFENYQINPFSMKSLDFVTPKIGTRPPKLDPKTIPGYETIKEAMMQAGINSSPKERYCEPQTSNQRYGWFVNNGSKVVDRDSYDERFRFSHRTADFIRNKASIKAYDHLMGNISSKGKAIQRSSSTK